MSDVTSALPVTADWEECASHHVIICESCQSFPWHCLGSLSIKESEKYYFFWPAETYVDWNWLFIESECYLHFTCGYVRIYFSAITSATAYKPIKVFDLKYLKACDAWESNLDI